MSRREKIIVPAGRLAELEELTARYESQLTRTHHAWLTGPERGLTDETIKRVRLGSVLRGQYAGCIAIPYLNYEGVVVDIRYRSLRDDGPKYMTRKGAITRIYLAGTRAKRHLPLLLCEGEFDALIAQQMGYQAYGFPGVATVKPQHLHLARKYPYAMLCGDGDDAGYEFNIGMRMELPDAEIVNIPSGCDLTSLYVKNGEEYLRGLIDSAIGGVYASTNSQADEGGASIFLRLK